MDALAGSAAGDQQPPVGRRGPVLPALVLDSRQVGAVSHGSQSLPSTTVPFEQNQPPVPLATASRASGTWRGPASPRSCLAASTSRNSPRWPGWSADRPPPSVLTGNSPPSWVRPPSTNGPPSPFLQKPRSSSVTSSM